MARRVSADLKAVMALEARPKQEIKTMILQERFVEFEDLSRKYEAKFKTDPRYESPLVKLYQSLDVQESLLPEKLDKWVATRPSYISHGARGIHNRYRGFTARGEKLARETPQGHMARMRELHLQAIPDLLAALQENRRFAPAYIALIAIDRAAGDTVSAEKALNEAVRWMPETYYVRHAYLRALHPRWGGDYSMMQAYASSLEQAARLNPRVWSLQAEVPAELGYSAWVSRDYPEAIKYYTEALRFGDRLEFLKSRGQLFLTTKDYAAARRDFARYVGYSTTDTQVNRWLTALEQYK